MKFTKLMSGLVLAVGMASAASTYSLKLPDAVWVGGTQLKAGEYKVEMQGDKAVFKSGKSVVTVPATIGQNGQKYALTSFMAEDSKLLEIDLGGTSEKILFGAVAASAAGSK
jgi:hypothetical protein